MSSEALSSLLDMIKQVPDDKTGRQRKERLNKKVANAAQIFCAEGALQQDHITFLTGMNNEAKPRRSTKPDILGKGKVMSYEDIEEARTKRAEKEATAAAKGTQGRKRKCEEADLPEPKDKMARTSTQGTETVAAEPTALMARMSQAQEAGASEPKAPVAWMSERQ